MRNDSLMTPRVVSQTVGMTVASGVCMTMVMVCAVGYGLVLRAGSKAAVPSSKRHNDSMIINVHNSLKSGVPAACSGLRAGSGR